MQFSPKLPLSLSYLNLNLALMTSEEDKKRLSNQFKGSSTRYVQGLFTACALGVLAVGFTLVCIEFGSPAWFILVTIGLMLVAVLLNEAILSKRQEQRAIAQLSKSGTWGSIINDLSVISQYPELLSPPPRKVTRRLYWRNIISLPLLFALPTFCVFGSYSLMSSARIKWIGLEADAKIVSKSAPRSRTSKGRVVQEYVMDLVMDTPTSGQITGRRIVSKNIFNRYQIGDLIRVRYLETNSSELMIAEENVTGITVLAFIVTFTGVIFPILVFSMMRERDARHSEILRWGEVSVGLIIDVQPGKWSPLVEVEYGPKENRHTVTCRVSAAGYKLGDMVPLLINKNDPKDVIVYSRDGRGTSQFGIA